MIKAGGLQFEHVHVNFGNDGLPREDGRPSVGDFLEAARCPYTLAPQEFGLWSIERHEIRDLATIFLQGNYPVTFLRRLTEATMHIGGETVMDDGRAELKRHLPIWLAAHGRVLVTGLGLGCVVRGLLVSPLVDHVDVIEIDKGIIKHVGQEFANDRRVTIHHGDALAFDGDGTERWDYAWHDLWTDGDEHLQSLHTKLLARFHGRVGHQGAWGLPAFIGRLSHARLLGMKRKFRP